MNAYGEPVEIDVNSKPEPESANISKRDNWLTLAGAVNILGLGGFMLWATFAPLAEGVTTTGQIIVDNEKKTIQHLEGGIISALNAKEGDVVMQGDVLVVLDTTTSLARRDQVGLQHATSIAAIKRIEALLNESSTLSFDEIDWRVPDLLISTITDQQKSLFINQKNTQIQNRDLLSARQKSVLAGTEGRRQETAALKASVSELNKEIALIESMVGQKLARRDELHRLIRQKSTLDGQLARLLAEVDEATSRSDELEQELRQSKASFRETLSNELVGHNATLSASEEELKSLEYAVTRAQVIAPVSGEILNLKFATLGGIVQPGEPIMEIVPKSSGLWASLQILPSDRDSIYPGLEVTARLSAFKSWQSPTIPGRVQNISADLKTIPETGLSYYEARIEFAAENLADHDIRFISPGMPVEAFVAAGTERTFMDYALEPIVAHFSKGLSNG